MYHKLKVDIFILRPFYLLKKKFNCQSDDLRKQGFDHFDNSKALEMIKPTGIYLMSNWKNIILQQHGNKLLLADNS